MNIDPAAVNTVLLAIFGIGGSVLIFRYISPILSTQEKNRVEQDKAIAKLRVEVDALVKERDLLKEMVTQRAQVDDLSQRVSIGNTERLQAVNVATVEHRLLATTLLEHATKNNEQHSEQVIVMREMVATLRSIEVHLNPWNKQVERRTASRVREDQRDERKLATAEKTADSARETVETAKETSKIADAAVEDAK